MHILANLTPQPYKIVINGELAAFAFKSCKNMQSTGLVCVLLGKLVDTHIGNHNHQAFSQQHLYHNQNLN